MSSPGALLRKINRINTKTKPFRVVILGQNGVGKTAMTVRFLTRRYIGDYDPLLERVYTCQKTLDGINVDFEVWDTAGQNENSKLKEQIRWADAIILMYDVTDSCSFMECSRLKFLTNALSGRARRKKTIVDPGSDNVAGRLPVFLVGNKIDKENDRMVSQEEGENRCRQLNCVNFREVSVSETIQEVTDIFEELYFFCKRAKRPQWLGEQLTASRLTLDFESQAAYRSSSDEDLVSRNAISLPVTPESQPNNVKDGGTKVRPDDVHADSDSDDKWMRSRSRRREALFMS